MSAMLVSAVIESLCAGNDLSADHAEAVFLGVVRGELSEPLLVALLVALKAKGETPNEVAGAARAFSRHALPFERPAYRFADCCGTGGDGHGTINLSTAAAFVAAEAGLPIAKHGSRSVSSRSGSADVIEALGARIDLPPPAARALLDEVGVTFLFGQGYHAGMRHAVAARRALGMRTMMNLIGPLVNPARPPVQLLGVYDPALIEPMAHTLDLLGCETALVVHGGGLDEIALHAPTRAALLRKGAIETIELTPEAAGVKPAPIEALRGGSPERNAAYLRSALQGRAPDAHRDAIAINAGALLWLAGRAANLREGTQAALAALASGRAHDRMLRFVARSIELAATTAAPTAGAPLTTAAPTTAAPISAPGGRPDAHESEVARGTA